MVDNNFISIVIAKEIMHFLDQLKPIRSFAPALLTKLSTLILGYSKISTTTTTTTITTTTTSITNVRPHFTDKSQVLNVTVDEINMVVGRWRMCNKIEAEGDEENFNEGVFEGIFVQEEPSLEEIWEAFKVFDSNRDGFVDAVELGRVLCDLGLVKEGSDVERYMLMIKGFDSNGDGLLDFNDFIKLMETCL